MFPRLTAALAGLLFFTLIPATAVGQETGDDPPTSPPGYATPSDVTDITRYRLPTWSYTNLWLNVSSSGSRSTRSTDLQDPLQIDREQTRSSLATSFRPEAETFYESEQRTFELRVTPVFDYDRRTQDEEAGNASREEDVRTVTSAIGVDLEWNEYVQENFFLAARTSNQAAYLNRSTTINEPLSPEDDVQNLGVVYASRARLGVGFGRVRDVTPVVRALRVRERLRALGREEVMGADAVQAAAQAFARRPGYTAIYDRPDKYFWNDLFSGIGNTADGLAPGEVFFVAEALQEPVARRLEGGEVRVGLTLDYENELDRTEDNGILSQRSRTIDSAYGVFASGEYFTNLGLRQQIGFVLDGQYLRPTEDDRIADSRSRITLDATWLYDVADRFQLDTQVNARYNRISRVEPFEAQEWTLGANVQTDARVFIENRLLLTAGVGYAYDYEDQEDFGDQTSHGMFFDVGVRYYLFRSLNI
ncbi:hypothetical protein [Longibacter sp.]|uniref:hypothetical protein n=1 Tax=Longibacter sp. TaxID=2045415 RepID=UPI003EBFCAC3